MHRSVHLAVGAGKLGGPEFATQDIERAIKHAEAAEIDAGFAGGGVIDRSFGNVDVAFVKSPEVVSPVERVFPKGVFGAVPVGVLDHIRRSRSDREKSVSSRVVDIERPDAGIHTRREGETVVNDVAVLNFHQGPGATSIVAIEVLDTQQ